MNYRSKMFHGYLALVVVAGCGGDPLGKVHVSGTVTFDGQECPAPGRVTFTPVEVADGLPKRLGRGKFKTDGKYEAASFRPGDGLVPGRYSVGISCFDGTKVSSAPSDAEIRAASYVDPSFKPLEIEVKPGGDIDDFNINVPRKKS